MQSVRTNEIAMRCAPAIQQSGAGITHEKRLTHMDFE
jgi:hypothetical protein